MKNKKPVASFSEKLRKLREEKGLNMKEMAKLLGIERTCYWRYENENTLPRIDILCNICQKLGISLDWLVLDRGPCRFADIQDAVKYAEKARKNPPKTNLVEIIDPDTRVLIKNMDSDPRFRHEVLLLLFDYIEKKNANPIIEND
jgi:transcriptional regulator with XRE-family HTH domain